MSMIERDPDRKKLIDAVQAVHAANDKLYQDYMKSEKEKPQAITIPHQLIASSARFVLVRPKAKGAFEPEWQMNTYQATSPKLIEHLKNGGNYGVVAHGGIGTMDIDYNNVYFSLGLKIPDTFTDCREECRYHVYFTCADLPEEYKAKLIKTVWGDIRLPGHNSFVVGPNCVSPNKDGELKEYTISNTSIIKDIPWSVLRAVIEKSLPLNKSESSITASPYPDPLKMTDSMHHQEIRRYVGNQVRANVPLNAIHAAVKVMNDAKLFDRVRGEKELITEVDGCWAWHQRRQAQKPETKAKKDKTALPDDPLAEFSEMRVAELFCEQIKNDYLFNGNTKQWHHWTGKVWEIDRRETIKTEYEVFARILYTKLASLQNETRVKAFQRIQHFNSYQGIEHVLKLTGHMLFRLTEDFDQNEDFLNVQNGTIEFVGDEIIIREHRKEDMISHIANVSYEPTEPIPQIWTNHINTVMMGDQGLIDNLQFLLGYSLQGGNPLERFTFMTGSGRNGKSVTLRAYSYILGDYAVEVNPLTLMEVGNKSNSPERKMMRGRRFIVAQETRKAGDQGKDVYTIDSGFLKACSGRDKVSFRDNHGNVLETFNIYGQVVLSTNNLPKVDDNTVSFWDRLILIPFNHYIADTERKPDIDKEFEILSTGIFNWCVEGWKKYRDLRKFTPCEAVRNTIEEYQTDADEYALFVNTCIERNATSTVKAVDLYVRYSEFCQIMGRAKNSDTKFGKDFKTRYPKKRTDGGMVYIGIMLK